MGPRSIQTIGWFFLLSVMNVIIVTANVQAAEDGKIYPASSCQPSTSSYKFSRGSRWFGGVSNLRRDKSMNILCPIVRDYMGKKAEISTVEVWFHNTNPRAGIFCRVATFLPNGKTLHAAKRQSPKGRVDGSLTIPYKADAGVWTTYALSCTLPPSTNVRDPVTIHSFKVIEQD